MEKNKEEETMKKNWLLIALALTLLLASCGQPVVSPTPTAEPEKATPTTTAIATEQEPTATPTEVAPEPTATTEPTQGPTAVEGEVITGEAMVESIEIMLLESFPIQVNVVARDNLPDSCTEISEITQGQAAPPNFTAIHCQHKWTVGQTH